MGRTANRRRRRQPLDRHAALEPVAATLVLAGGLALRWVFVAAGQSSALVAFGG